MTEYECPTPETYSKELLRDWRFYVQNRHRFSFSAKPLSYYAPPEGDEFAIECFKRYDSEGEVTPCGQPVLFAEVMRCKASVNLHVKMWAEGRAGGTLLRPEFNELMKEIEAPQWVTDAVEKATGKAWERQQRAA